MVSKFEQPENTRGTAVSANQYDLVLTLKNANLVDCKIMKPYAAGATYNFVLVRITHSRIIPCPRDEPIVYPNYNIVHVYVRNYLLK